MEWICQRGIPKCIFSDQGPHYTSYTLARWCTYRGIVRIVAAPNLHKSVGPVERINQTLLGRLRRMCYNRSQEDWALLIPEAIRMMNEIPQLVTEYVPNDLLIYGPREWDIARRRTQRHRDEINRRLGTNRICSRLPIRGTLDGCIPKMGRDIGGRRHTARQPNSKITKHGECHRIYTRQSSHIQLVLIRTQFSKCHDVPLSSAHRCQ